MYGGISDLRTAQSSMRRGLASPHDPPRVPASIVMLGACRPWHLARLALLRADARKSPLVTARHCESGASRRRHALLRLALPQPDRGVRRIHDLVHSLGLVVRDNIRRRQCDSLRSAFDHLGLLL